MYVMSQLQGNEPLEFMETVGLKYHPRDMGIGRMELRETAGAGEVCEVSR